MIRVNSKAKKLFKIELKTNNISKNKLEVSSYFNNLQQMILEKNNELKLVMNNNKNVNKVNELKHEINLLNKQMKNSSLATSIQTKNIKFSARTIRLGWFYKINNIWFKILLVCLLGILSSVVIWLFVQYTGLYSAGISGIIQGIAKIVKIGMDGNSESLINLVYNIIFWCLYFLINIPLLIFSYFKISKEFCLLTVIYITFSQLIGFGLGFINNGNGIFIFTDMTNITSESTIFISDVQLLPWNSSNGLVIGLFIYGLVYAIVSGTTYSILYILGSSTGGTDIFGLYYSKIKNKSIGTLLTYFNATSLFLGVLLGSFVCWIMKSSDDQKTVNNILEAIFSPNLIVSLLSTALAGLIYNYFFPRNKIIKVQLYSKKSEDVVLSLLEKEWTYKVVISNNSDSLAGDSNSKTLETVCSYIDLPILISNIREIDATGLITIYSIFGVDGELPTTIYERQVK